MPIPSIPCSSPDITTLSYSARFDISGASPVVVLTNASTIVNANQLTWWYVITTPSGLPIHEGSVSNPDVGNATWSTLQTGQYSWPTPFGNPPCGQIEFSQNAPYVCTLYVKDSVGNIFSLAIQQAITRPNGNTSDSCGNFGVANVSVEVKCNDNAVFCGDSTNLAYQSVVAPTSKSNQWTLVYPPDANGNQPANGTAANTPYVNFPFSYSGEGYVLYFGEYCTYDMGNGASIKVQYKALSKSSGAGGITFAVLCNINLCKLSCQINEFYNLSKKKCGNLVDANLMYKMTQMNLLLTNAIIGISNPLCGIDVNATIKEIQVIGDLDPNCNCGCGDTGQGFSYPINPAGNNGTGCCPVSTRVIDKATSNPPSLCPASYFPVNVYDPTGVTIIGRASNINDLVAILNTYSGWVSYGTAFAEGNCKVGWFKATGAGTIPDVKVDIIPVDVLPDNIVVIDILDKDTDAPPALCPGNFYPVKVYAPNGATEIGTANNIADLVGILNGYSAWSTYGTASAQDNCHVQWNLINPNNIPPDIKVEIIPNVHGSGVNQTVPIYEYDSFNPPSECTSSPPTSPYPAKVYNVAGTAILAIVNSIVELISVLNSDAEYSSYGTWYYTPGYCDRIQCTLADNTVLFPEQGVQISPASSTTCVGSQQMYTVQVNDICATDTTLTPASFPINVYIDFGDGAGVRYVGNYANQSAMITGLNATAGKPGTMTFSATTTTPNMVTVNNTTCSANVLVITADLGSQSFLLQGGNHTNVDGAARSKNGYFGTTLKTNTVLGRAPGPLPALTTVMFHTTKLIGGYTACADNFTGKVYLYDNTLPLQPNLFAQLTLSNPSSNSFTGLPLSAYTYTGTTHPSFYSLYMPTDYHTMSINDIYLFESTTGTAWHMGASGLIAAFVDTKLKGKCPRVMVNNKIYFTQDGDMETYTGSSGVVTGSIVILDLSDFTSTGLSTQLLLPPIEAIWAASYDGAGKIYFTGKAGTIITYDPFSDTVLATNATVFGGGFSFNKRLNTSLYMGKLYCTAVQSTALNLPIVDVATFTFTNANPFGVINLLMFNFIPLGNCLALITYEELVNNLTPTGRMMLVKLDGSKVADIPMPSSVSFYNVIPFGNVNATSPTNFISI